MVFGKTLLLPGEFIELLNSVPTDPAECLLKLREIYRPLKPTPVSYHSSTSCFVHAALNTCSPAFVVRVDGLKPSGIAPYQGPFEVLSRTDKRFIIKRSDKTTVISIDRLEPAFLLNDTNSKEPFPVQKTNSPVVHAPRPDSDVPVPTTTRSGRKVCFNPKYL
ncbi:gag-Pol polyprotein [Nephila pilipes]|uniref:Gag-Pol polyprotein n=1 Tax=Nephila pilipes TaxID=299642 RepID=A0A8X6QZ75_NEPPI|nr:gag-Pol polyprotein [Nephila pilipes]